MITYCRPLLQHYSTLLHVASVLSCTGSQMRFCALAPTVSDGRGQDGALCQRVTSVGLLRRPKSILTPLVPTRSQIRVRLPAFMI